MRSQAFLAFFIGVSAVLAAPAASASGDDPARSRQDTLVQTGGTNVKGQSGNFAEYLNEGEEDNDSDSLELMRISEDAKVDLDGEDGVAARFGY